MGKRALSGRLGLVGRIAFFGASALAVLPATAQAQSADDEIVVTAQKREERTLDIGLNVATVSAEALKDARVTQVNDLGAVIGNIDIKEQVPGAIPVVTIRGVGLDDFSATNSASAGIYVDEVYLASTGMMSTELFDLARVEVLKGPQGTLYGRNSTAGAINIITQAPKDAFEASAMAGYGDYETAEAELILNLPVSEQLALRFAGRGLWQDEGYYTSRALPGQTLGSREVYAGRAQALLQLTDKLDVLLKLEGERSNSEMGQPEFFGAINPMTFGPCAPILAGRVDNTQCTDFFGYTDTDGDPFIGDWTTDAHYDIEAWDATLKINGDLGFATLTSVTGYRSHDRSFFIDADATPLPQVDFNQTDRVEQVSQELRLTGDTGKVKWVLGAFASHDEVTVYTPGFHDFLFATRTRIDAYQETDSVALFANGDWALSDRLSLVTGVRFTSEERSYIGGTTDLNPFGVSLLCGPLMLCAPVPGSTAPLSFINSEISDDNVSWRLGLEFKPTQDSLLYATVSRGTKSGGYFSGITTSTDQLRPYEPEELTAYEVGAKAKYETVRLEASVFYYDYQDFQAFVRFDGGFVPVQKLDNIDSAEVFGADFDVLWSPLPDTDVTLRLGLLDTELSAFATTAGPVAAGNRLPNAPELTFSGGVRQGFRLSDALRLEALVDASYADDVFKDALNDPLIASPSHWLFNARLALMPTEGPWEFAVYGRNLGDEQYVVNGLNVTSLGFGNRNYNAPRTWGVELRYSWR